MAKPYKLEITDLPPRRRHGVYDEVVEDFIKDVLDNPTVAKKTAKVVMAGKQVKTMQIGLAKAAQATGRKDMSVRLINNEVYITKK